MHTICRVARALYACVLPRKTRDFFRLASRINSVGQLHDLHVAAALQSDNAVVVNELGIIGHSLQQGLDVWIQGAAVLGTGIGRSKGRKYPQKCSYSDTPKAV